MTDHLLLPAAGLGSRFQSTTAKQYHALAGRTVLEWTLAAWDSVALTGQRWLVVRGDDRHARELLRSRPELQLADGGGERAESVLAGLRAMEAKADDWVFVHDVARPCVRAEDIERLRRHCHQTGQGGLLAVPLTDTIKRRSANGVSTLDRRLLWAAQTPQCFRYGELRRALESALAEGQPITDEASAMEWAGYPVELVEGHRDNLKLTRPDDLALVKFYLGQQQRL